MQTEAMARVVDILKKNWGLLLVILIVTNTTLFKQWTGINKDYFRYSNYGGTFTTKDNFSFLDIFEVEKEVKYFYKDERFIRCNPNSTDTVLYRLFAINPLKFWRWGEYLFSWKYQLPYIDWLEVRQRRGYDLREQTCTQEF